MNLSYLKTSCKLYLEKAGVRRRRFFGLNDLDRKLLNFITNRNGFFIEAGANDGLSQSNTAHLEIYLGWRGILVEPIPKLAQICRSNRPKAIVENFALVSEDFEFSSVAMTYCNLMSIVNGARGSPSADKEHLDAGRTYLQEGDIIEKLEVPCCSLNDILEKHRVNSLDLLSLDLEGYEPQALSGLNFERFAPRWILVEANDPAAVENILKHKYRLVAMLSHHDRLYSLK
jgi:FkbM family methyltransferase